ncbi:hypothetical protein [Fretibacterium sp. OH1220_COT-178]|uniref:hypothetical protein n=1 Tax=Fretibacterium sp. OH1220_COT-178 TaxID=2491047 RepID=UPI0013150FB7|nr:hypothetical protein [Fretibacterium sp. OH1220_COT-178]
MSDKRPSFFERATGTINRSVTGEEGKFERNGTVRLESVGMLESSRRMAAV